MRRLVFPAVLVILFLFNLGSADVPQLINYQGMLTNLGGSPVTDGQYNLTFKIYGSESGDDSLWWEYHTSVDVANGLFNVILGSISSLDLSFDTDYWLGVRVGTDPELIPRTRLTSVGYAYRSRVADSAVVATPGSGSHWSASDSILYTNNNWGIARGGAGNVLYGDSAHTMVNLGIACTTGASGNNRYYATISGGYRNHATDILTTVSGGKNNQASRQAATVGGGLFNSATENFATVSGGWSNTADGIYATVSGGWHNTASGWSSTIGGGGANIARGVYSVVAGGGSGSAIDTNAALGDWSTIPGGRGNVAKGNYSFASGRRAQALHHGTFVWADSTDSDFASTGNNQFLIRASGGVGIGTTNPTRLLHLLAANPRILLEASSSNPEINFEHSGDPESEIWALYKHGASDDFRFYQNGADRVTIQDGTGNVGIGATDPGQKLDINGIARIRSWGLTPTYDVQVNNDGDLCRVSSSKRYKKNIRGLESDLDKILNLKPVSFEWKTTSERDIGLIAEDVHELIPELVGYDKEGRPDAVKYDKVAIYLLEVVRIQHERISALEKEIAELKD